MRDIQRILKRCGKDKERLVTGIPTVTIAISTRGTRAAQIDDVVLLPHDGVDYLLLGQDPDAARIPKHLEARPDVSVARLNTTGLSRSRNAALDLARGEVLLITDDDVTHFPETYGAVRTFYVKKPEVDFWPAGPSRPGSRANVLPIRAAL